MEYNIASIEDVPPVDLGNLGEVEMEPDVRRVQSELGAENMVANFWEFEEGDAMIHHRHEKQEELYYVVEGEFRLKVGEAGETKEYTVSEGELFVASPETGRGYRCVSEGGGHVLSVGAPNLTDINPEEYTSFEEA
jgi:quercetin dioxygenase-like cupin family protein